MLADVAEQKVVDRLYHINLTNDCLSSTLLAIDMLDYKMAKTFQLLTHVEIDFQLI